jgi:glycosyltransferase involved in cell wall biosynthesis
VIEAGFGRQPFVTIGVTTYYRHDLLRQTLNSILAQTFGDFEVIVGNDYTEEMLTGEMLGITDPRIRIVNHPRNLREVGNMNALLGMATGRYFTWLFDDDLYEPNFLQTAHDCLAETEFPPAFFSSFRMMQENEQFQPREIHHRTLSVLTGREFLGRYSARRPEVVSTCGLFDTAVLRNVVGGVEELCASAIGVYCEYLFLVRCGLLEKIVYVDAPFVLFRIHVDSWSESPSELGKYVEAGKELVRKSAEVLRHPTLAADFNANLLMICEQHLITIAHRSAKIEVARKKFGVLAVWHALSRYRKEALSTRRAFVNQGGDINPRTRLNFAKMDINCYRIMALILASCFYRNFRPLKRV